MIALDASRYQDNAELNSPQSVIIKFSGHEDLVLERLERSTRIATLKESIRVKWEVAVAQQELFQGNRRAEDYSILSAYTPERPEEGIIFRLQVKGSSLDDLYS